MAKPNYSFAKRQRELAKKKKKEEKRQRKAAEQQEGQQEEQPPEQELGAPVQADSEAVAPESSDPETTAE
jgi:hypothetical protein